MSPAPTIPKSTSLVFVSQNGVRFVLTPRKHTP